MYPPLCGEELKAQSYTARPRGVPIPETAQAGPEGLRCIRRCVGRNSKNNHTRAPPRTSLSPKRPRQDRRDSSVSAAVWGGPRSLIIPDPPPHGASLSPKRPM